MKTLLKLTTANIKMYFRDKSALFFTLFFPFIVIAIFGVLDFAKFSTSKIGIVYDESTKQYADGVKEALSNIGDQYKIEEGSLEDEKQALTDDDRLLVLEFTPNGEDRKVNVKAYLNKGNEQAAQATFLVVQKILADFELSILQVQPMFNIDSEVINVFELRNIDYMVPGVVAMSLMQGGLFGVIGTIVDYREKGILKRLFATPLSKSNFLISQILSRLVVSIIQVLILLVTSYVIFKIKIVGSLVLVAFLAILGSLTFLSLGFAISGIAKTSESARAIIMPVQMILMFTSGVYFSREVLPTWLYDITAYTPLTYLSDGLRDVMTRGYGLLDDTVKTATIGISVWLIIFIILAIRSFKWEKK
ncbi:ABC transporter permease [Candidatus Dojkabacteria bacterium]|nr:ABC transporter permease [Candidatus Dojkabacteria bacterium]